MGTKPLVKEAILNITHNFQESEADDFAWEEVNLSRCTDLGVDVDFLLYKVKVDLLFVSSAPFFLTLLTTAK